MSQNEVPKSSCVHMCHTWNSQLLRVGAAAAKLPYMSRSAAGKAVRKSIVEKAQDVLATRGIQSHKKVPKLLNGQVHIKPSENGEIDSHQSVPFKEPLLLFSRDECRWRSREGSEKIDCGESKAQDVLATREQKPRKKFPSSCKKLQNQCILSRARMEKSARLAVGKLQPSTAKKIDCREGARCAGNSRNPVSQEGSEAQKETSAYQA